MNNHIKCQTVEWLFPTLQNFVALGGKTYYIILPLFQSWLVERKIRKLVVVLTSVETKEVLERWEFKVEYEEGADQTTEEGGKENVDNNAAASQKGFRNVSNKVRL